MKHSEEAKDLAMRISAKPVYNKDTMTIDYINLNGNGEIVICSSHSLMALHQEGEMNNFDLNSMPVIEGGVLRFQKSEEAMKQK